MHEDYMPNKIVIKFLILVWALKVHQPYISDKIAQFSPTSIVLRLWYNQNGLWVGLRPTKYLNKFYLGLDEGTQQYK